MFLEKFNLLFCIFKSLSPGYEKATFCITICSSCFVWTEPISYQLSSGWNMLGYTGTAYGNGIVEQMDAALGNGLVQQILFK